VRDEEAAASSSPFFLSRLKMENIDPSSSSPNFIQGLTGVYIYQLL
jgi:hypothetical protein